MRETEIEPVRYSYRRILSSTLRVFIQTISIYQYFEHTPDYLRATRVIVNNVYIVISLYIYTAIVSINKVLFALTSSRIKKF